MNGLAADYTRPGSLAGLADICPDYVVATLKPLGRGAEAYNSGFKLAMKNLLSGLGSHRPRGLFMVSSTRVYAEGNGGWVDEDSPLDSGSPQAAAIIAAEQQLLDSGAPATILRCGGIYGEPRGRLLTRVAQGELTSAEPVRYSNRIHRDDVAGFIAYLIARRERGEALLPIYNVVDNAPVPQHEAERWLAAQLGVAEVRQSRPVSAGHKRCRNDRLLSSGYPLRYADYQSGYRAVLAGS